MTNIINQLHTISPWLPLGLFCVGLFLLFVFFIALSRYFRIRNEKRHMVFGDDIEVWPYKPIDFMTKSEVKFYKRLVSAVNSEYLIFAQVQLSRIIDASEDMHSNEWLNRISRMSADYVLVADDAQTALLVVELDDWSHDLPEHKRRDAKKNKALACAGVPILRYHGEDMPETEKIRSDIKRIIHKYYEFE